MTADLVHKPLTTVLVPHPTERCQAAGCNAPIDLLIDNGLMTDVEMLFDGLNSTHYEPLPLVSLVVSSWSFSGRVQSSL